MSPEQESIWLNDRLHSGSRSDSRAACPYVSPYVENWTHRLRGPLDPGAIEQALTTLVARHEALRTRLALAPDGTPRQHVAPPGPVPLRRVTVAPAGLDAALRRAVSTPVPLDEPPLLRATLLKQADDDHVLALALHHAVLDSWSLGLLDEEFGELYAAAAEGRAHQLPPLPLQFGPYAERLRARPDAAAAGPVEHWRGVLAGAPAASAFPSHRARPATPSRRGGQVRFRVSPTTYGLVQSLARTLRATPFALLAAALSTLLARLSGQDDVVLGTPVSRRDAPELAPLIGCLTDLLPLRGTVRADDTFTDLALRTKDAVWDAVAHREVSYGRLVRDLGDALGVDRGSGRFPLFQVVLAVDDADPPGLRLPGLAVERLHPHNGTAKFDAFFRLIPERGGLTGLLEYATDLFDAADARRLVDRFTTLLDDAVRRPDRPVRDLALLPNAERATLRKWSTGPARQGPEPPLVHEALRAQAARTPDLPAVVQGDRTLTYRALDRAADALAHRLRAHGHGPGSRVALCLPRGPEAAVAVLAVLKAGACCVPVDPAYPPAHRALILRGSEATLLLTTRGTPPPHEAPKTLYVDDPHPADDPGPGPLPQASPADPVYLIHTSGSTGRPKGVVLPHRALAALVDWQRTHSLVTEVGARTLQFAPLGFDVAFQELFATWAAGGTLVLTDEAARRDPERLLDLIEDARVDRLFLPFVALQQLAEYAAATRRRVRLREVVTAGEQLYVTPALRTFFGELTTASLENQYGPSETHVITAHRLTGPPADWPERPPIGRPLPGTTVRILDPDLRPVPLGATGELCLGGHTLAAGYTGYPNSTEETARRFVHAAGERGAPGERLYRSGDLGRFLPDGTIEFLGRRDGQVKIRGHRVEPAGVEAALRALGGVRDAAVVATGSPARLVAHYTPADGPAPDALRRALAERLPAHLLPARLVPAERLPLTPSGKVDRAALAAKEAPEHATAATPPRTPVEHRIARHWQRALDLPRLPSVHDDFFATGGDSLRAARLLLALRADPDAPDLPLNALFSTPTVAGLAARCSTVGTRPKRRPEAELRLAPDIRPTVALPAPRHLLLTGATGFLGAFLLRELLRRTDATVHCLVRGPHAGRRLAAALDGYGIEHPGLADRVRCVPGDLAAPRLGLAPETYDELARTVDAVHHCGAEVHLTRDYEQLSPPNVTGTEEVLRLAAAHRTVPVHHVSTVGVLSGAPPGGGAFHPDAPLPPPNGLRHGYARTKWAAESLIDQARGRGLPVTVYRPTRITGDTATGVAPDTDLLWLLLQACARAEMCPEAGTGPSFDLIPVDRAAAAVAALSLDPRASGRTFHLAAERRLTLTEAAGRLRAHGFRIAERPLADWRRALESTPAGPALLAVLTDDCGRLGSEGAYRIDASTTRELLAEAGPAGAGIELRGDGRTLFDACVRHFRRTGFLTGPGPRTTSNEPATPNEPSGPLPESATAG